MVRAFAILIVISSLFLFSCRHDTSQLERTSDTNISSDISDITSTDVDSDKYDYEDIEAADSEDARDITDTIGDVPEELEIYDILDISDVQIDIEDIYDGGITEDIPDTEQIETEDITDILDISDTTSDIICSNQCESSGAKECYQYQNKWYVRECKDTNSDGCLEWENVAFCSYGCENRECKSCVPDCTNKECGDNGCGGSCGYCDNPPQNKCQDSNTLLEYYSLGTCVNDKCNYDYKQINCQYGCTGGVCKNCIPDCNGKNCGPDGCGGSCGNCNDLQTCLSNGICECKFVLCNGICCNELEVCNKGQCCEPDCAGKECGPDKCGGVCGECIGNDKCIEGICQPFVP